jgi:hypothetical protein
MMIYPSGINSSKSGGGIYSSPIKNPFMRNTMESNKDNKTYYTLGGVVTKDTLSSTEQKELVKKHKNGTLTEDDRDKLLYDDSSNSVRSTTGIIQKDRVTYNPNVEYFMLDYHIKDECRWVRMGYMTQLELLDHMKQLYEDYNINFSGLRIHSEKELDVKYKVEYEDGEYRELTLRHILFDERYEQYSNYNKSKDPEWKDFMKYGYEERQSRNDLDERKEVIENKLLRNEELDFDDENYWEVSEINSSFSNS